MVHKVRCLGEPKDPAACLVSVAEMREVREVSAGTSRHDRDLYGPLVAHGYGVAALQRSWSRALQYFTSDLVNMVLIFLD